MTIQEYEKYMADLILSVGQELDNVHKVMGHNTSAEMSMNRAKFLLKLVKDHENKYLLSQYILR